MGVLFFFFFYMFDLVEGSLHFDLDGALVDDRLYRTAVDLEEKKR